MTSLDTDTYLTRWAGLIHHQRGVDHVRCHAAGGFPEQAPYNRMVAWVAPPLRPQTWVDQVGTILADAPDSPSLTVLRDWLKQWEEAGRPSGTASR